MSGAPKGLWPAVSPTERVGILRWHLYRLYDRDDAVGEALTGFYARWWTRLGAGLRRESDCLPDLDDHAERLVELVGAEPARDYMAALRALAAESGLDRIPLVGTPPIVIAGYLPSGIGQLHRFLWHLDKALLWEAVPENRKVPASEVRRPTFESLASFGTGIPDVDTSMAGTGAHWDPRTELRADAVRRLNGETDLGQATIETELARIGAAGGYEFPDTATQRSGIWRPDRDAEWAFWRIRRRWTYPQIATEWERLHPGDLRLPPRRDDPEAREWQRRNPHELAALEQPADAVGLIRKAVKTFARRARITVGTGPGRPRGRRSG